MNLVGKTIVIIGATGDIGSNLASQFDTMEANVVAIVRKPQDVERIESLGPKVKTLVLQPSIVADMEEAIKQTESLFGKPDILITSVGKWEMVDVDSESKYFAHQLQKDFAGFMQASTVPMFVFNQYFRSNDGTIIDISSNAAEGFLPGNLTYGPMKAAVKFFMDNMRGENGPESKVKILRAISQLVNTAKNRESFPQFSEKDWATAVQIEDIAKWIAHSEGAATAPNEHFFKSGIIL